MFLTRRKKVVIIGLTALGVSLAAAVNYTGLCRLEAVTLNGQPVTEWTGPYAILGTQSVARQPLSALADSLLEQKDVYRVDINLDGLRGIEVITNQYTPRALLLDNSSGKLFGLDEYARLLPLANATMDWECPIITGLAAGHQFTVVSEQGLVELLRQLQQVEDKHQDLYRLIEEIHFTDGGSLKLTTSGLPFILMLYPDQLARRIDSFVEFYTRFDADLSLVELIDLRFDEMIIVREEG
ncbi:MAG: hypothetical protein ABIE70_13360 [bacterium]